MTAKWLPPDDELDGLARTLDVPALAPDDAEQHRTQLLARAANAQQLGRRSPMPIVIAIGTSVAAAAAVLLWVGLRPDERTPGPHADVVAIGDATFSREQRWPRYTVRVERGRVAVDVATVEAAHQFVAVTSDAQIVVRSAKLVVGAEQNRLTWVDVKAGSIELRYAGATIVLAAGQTWQPKIAQTAEVITPPSPPPAMIDVPADPVVTKSDTQKPTRVVRKPAHLERHGSKRDVAVAEVRSEPVAVADASSKPADIQQSVQQPTTQPTPSAPRPGELDFRAGIAALRTGDAAAATKSFAAACAAARNDALGEDACFWVGGAANRAGQTTRARDALVRFVREFPRSARIGEASALLGWLLYTAGELDGAEARFKVALTDRVPKVRESAQRGLEAIKRKRVTNP